MRAALLGSAACGQELLARLTGKVEDEGVLFGSGIEERTGGEDVEGVGDGEGV